MKRLKKGHKFIKYEDNYDNNTYICKNCKTIIRYLDDYYAIWPPSEFAEAVPVRNYYFIENEPSCNEVIIKNIIE